VGKTPCRITSTIFLCVSPLHNFSTARSSFRTSSILMWPNGRMIFLAKFYTQSQ
jgi:hypothetical protein